MPSSPIHRCAQTKRTRAAAKHIGINIMAPPLMFPSPSSSVLRHPAAQQADDFALAGRLGKAVTGKSSATAGLTLRKLLPKIGFSWPVTRRKNIHTRKVEHRLAGLSASERSRIMRALRKSLGPAASARLEKWHVERALVELFEVATSTIKSLSDFSDPSGFWSQLSEAYRSSGAWFSDSAITGETLYNLAVLAVKARTYDQDHGKPSRWMAALKQQSPLVHAVDGFIWRLEYEYENSSRVLDAYFGQIIEGAVHLDIPQKDELQELWRKLDKLNIEDLQDDGFDELLSMMSRLEIDVDEEMLDVEFLEECWWPGHGIE